MNAYVDRNMSCVVESDHRQSLGVTLAAVVVGVVAGATPFALLLWSFAQGAT